MQLFITTNNENKIIKIKRKPKSDYNYCKCFINYIVNNKQQNNNVCAENVFTLSIYWEHNLHKIIT